MGSAQDVKIYLGSTDDGKWVAATASSPFFCFEGESEEEVVGIATRAVKFYFSSEDRIGNVIERARNHHSTVVEPKRTVTAKELVCA